MGSQQHTPEPWGYDGYTGIGAISSDQFNDGYFTAEVMGPDKEANARRIVACVNALEGVPPEWLEAFRTGNVKNVLQDLATVTKQRDELLAVLDKAESAIRELAVECDGDYELADALASTVASVKGGSK